MPRRKIQRAFLSWIEENRARFAIAMKLGQRADKVLEFSFDGINRAIAGELTTWEIIVSVTHEDEFWDALLWLETVPKHIEGGYVCDLCPPESRPIFPDRESLWT